MRVVLTHPYCWPWVRRGSERFIAEFADFLQRRGHEVLTISSKPGWGTIEHTPAGKRILTPQLWFRLMAKARVQPTHTFVPNCAAVLSRIEADVVQSLHYSDAFAANLCRRHGSYRNVYQITGAPVPSHFPRYPGDRSMLAHAIRHANQRVVHSKFVANVVEEYYGFQPEVIPVPIDLSRFEFETAPADRTPILLALADFEEPRKGLRVLIRAFARVVECRPGIRLQLSGRLSERTASEVLSPLPSRVRDAIDLLGPGEVEDLPKLFQRASLTVLPSMWEAYGMVVVESWACGTPVVVTDHAGLAELVTSPLLGTKFDPGGNGLETSNDEGLAAAICSALRFSECRESHSACRQRAESLSWDIIGPRYEEVWRRC